MDGIKPPRPQKRPRLTLSSSKTTPPVTTASSSSQPEFALPSPKKRGWRLFLIVAGIITFLLVGAGAAGFWWYQDALAPRSASDTTVTVVIEEGASVEDIAKELEQKSVIKNGLAFVIYTKLHSKGLIKTGTYMFAPNQSVREIVAWLHEGKVSTRKVTILPGKTLKQIKASLVVDGFTEADVDAAFAKTYDHPLFADKPAGASLEGYIFPETYFVTAGSTAEELLVRTFDEFESQIEAEGLRAKLAARGFDLFQGVTLASVVAREVGNPTDQAQVAQVLETRLSLGMTLGADATYRYAAEQMGVEPSVNLDSPYNTRIYTGLPPGPIANFNLSALQAVAEPAEGDYLYFVSGDDGVTRFSRTFEEHLKLIEQYCQKICSQA